MKQHITKKQWDELNDKEKKIWCKKTTGNFSGLKTPTDYPTIGQMIEFLGDDYLEVLSVVRGNAIYKMVEARYVCDALWEAVKYKLKI